MHLLLLVPVPALDPTGRGILFVRVLERRRNSQVRHVVAVQLQVLQRRKQALHNVFEQEVKRRGSQGMCAFREVATAEIV